MYVCAVCIKDRGALGLDGFVWVKLTVNCCIKEAFSGRVSVREYKYSFEQV